MGNCCSTDKHDGSCVLWWEQEYGHEYRKRVALEATVKAQSSELARMKEAKDSWKHDAMVMNAEVARLRWKLTEALETLHVVHAYRGAQNAEALMLREVVRFLSHVKDQLPDALKKDQEGL
jgi:hypothetical protein